jgi:hypothetical protein
VTLSTRADGAALGLGLSRYTAPLEARAIAGHRSDEIEAILGYPGRAALVPSRRHGALIRRGVDRRPRAAVHCLSGKGEAMERRRCHEREIGHSRMMMALGAAARAAAAELAFAPGGGGKRMALEVAADTVEARVADIIAANEKDMAFGREKGCRRRCWTG